MIEILRDHYPLLLEGFVVTIQLVVISSLLTAPLALLTAVGRISRRRSLRAVAATYTEVFRSLPVLVLLIGFYYGLGPHLTPLGIKPMWIAIVALVLNEAAYLAENYRSVLAAIPAGQWRACVSFGLTKGQALRYVIIPQFYPASLPHLTNAIIYLVKSSALASLITIQELMAVGYRIVFQTFEALTVLTLVLVGYLAFTTAVAYLLRTLERWLVRRYQRPSRSPLTGVSRKPVVSTVEKQ